MDKKKLQDILSAPYNLASWQEVLVDVFGARNLLQSPQQIFLTENKRVESALELGNFNTADDRMIGLYQIRVNSGVHLEHNKVGLREILRNVYKYDVDGALVVFVQDEKWRLSFISEIRTLNEVGVVIKNATEPKRYTYLLGECEKTKTPTDRLFSISGKPYNLEDIRNVFSVEALNEEFYRIIAEHFYQLVGADTIGKGKTHKSYTRKLQLPSVDENNNKIYHEFAVRLIGRIVFCWFLKVKKSNAGLSLLPEYLLSSDAVKKYTDYYHSVLELIFFQTLNTPIEKRRIDLPTGCEQIPFLNGGLFDPHAEDFYRPNKYNAQSECVNTLKLPNAWFLSLFNELEKYNFTIDENSTVDVEVSVDPEMLGRIFENLLAEIDPDSGETARKSTGSFYTPREIVDYMATESLVQYLSRVEISNLNEKEKKEALYSLFRIDQPIAPVLMGHCRLLLLEALDTLKILDPACGSGAFPIGMLQKIVMALQKLDKDCDWWKESQISKSENPILRKHLREKLESSAEYARKIGIIQNSLYGVDIQPIAADISKLRCFLTLIVDENIVESKYNRGVDPLPNLEFKFVTADSLMQLPKEKDFGGLFNANEDLKELHDIRLDYLQSSGEEKDKLKVEFERIRQKISEQQFGLGKCIDLNSRAYKISSWNPFSNEKAEWFDPMWMYGFKDFDIVIGNPPYGVSIKGEYRTQMEKSLGKVPDYEIYYYFIERAELLLKQNGTLSYVIPNSFLFNTFAKSYRTKLTDHWDLSEILDCSNFPIFKSAVVRNSIINWNKAKSLNIGYRNTKDVLNFPTLILRPKQIMGVDELGKFLQNWGLAFKLDKQTIRIIRSISDHPKILRLFDVSQGYIPYRRSDLIKKFGEEGNRIVDERKWHSSSKISDDYIQEIFGTDIKKYNYSPTNCFVKYGTHLAGYVDLCFFNNKRLLIREITNPSIIGCIVEETFVNDPQILNVIPKSKIDSIYVECLWAIINSKLATFYHCNSSPKATKGAFPKILVQDIKDFPLPDKAINKSLASISKQVLFAANLSVEKAINQHVPNSHIVQAFEEVINAMVYELYFEKDFMNAGIEFIKYVERDFECIDGKEDNQKIEIIHNTYQKLREKDNEIRNNLKLMDIKLADLVGPIKNGK